MSDAPAIPASAPEIEPPARPSRLGMKIVRRVLVAVAIVLALLLGAGVGVRYGVRTSAGRSLVMKLLDGLPVGPMGRLHVAGMGGDLFDAFGFRELSIVDARGPWLTARDLTLVWDPAELLARRVHASHIHAGLIQVLRQPVMTKAPPQPPSKPPVSLILDDVKVRLETAPAFSVQRGLWDLNARAELHRSGRVRADLAVKSLLHAGDGGTLALRFGKHDRFVLRADLVEAHGGALAGALGLPINQSLAIHAVGDATAAEGQAQLQAIVGGATPLQATARWSKAGVLADGQVSLTASRLTKFFADRLGPEARIHVTASQTKGDLYAVDGVVEAQGGSLHLTGPLNWTRQTTSGLAVTAAVADLSKWITLPRIGPARAAGQVVGGAGDFTFKGAFQGEKLDQYGYGLARIAGPASFSLKGRTWRAQADLVGAGGSGKGLPAALLGPTPHVQLGVSTLEDGHMLFRSLNVSGAGVKIAAQGGEGLFGRLSFKGSGEITNLAALRPGARGGLTGTWDAGENKGGKAWDVAFDGKGVNFASGLADLDHFLGPSPRLSAKGSYGAEGLAIADARLVGAALEAQGKGGLDLKQAVSAEFTWSAKGPIAAGPVEIAGAAKGEGRISGALSAPRADLTAELASLDFGQLVVAPAKLTLTFLQGSDGLTGAVALSGPTAKYGPAAANAAFHFEGQGIDLSDIVADAGGVKLAGSLALRSGEPSSADLTFAAGPGAFLASGRLAGTVKLIDQPGGARASLAVEGQSVSAPGALTTVHTLSLHADGPLKQLPFQISADSLEPIGWKLAGTGVLNHTPTSNQITLQGGGRIRKADFKFLEPAVVRIGGPDQGAHMKLAIAGGQAEIDAQAVGDALTAKAQLTKVGLGAFSEDFTGTVSGAATLQGKGPHLGGALEGTLSGARNRDAPSNEGLNATVKATLADSRLHLEGAAANAEGLKSNAVFDLPAETSAAPFRIAIDRGKAVRGQFSADGEIRPLWDLFAGGERTLTGHVVTSGAVQGSLNNLVTTGQGALSGGKFRDVVTGLALQNLEVDTTFGDGAITVRRFSGADARGGTISGDGRVSVVEDGASTFTLNLKRFQLIDNDLGRATASGAVTVTHPAKGQGKLTGQLQIDRADIVAATPTPTGVVPMDVVEVHQVIREGQEKPQPRTLGPPILLDVAIKAERGVYVKGKGLNVELSLDSHVGGSVSQPDLTGVAKVVGGSYDFAGKRFDMDSSGTVRLGSTPSQIRLNLSATWEDPTLTAVVRVRGTAAKPEITLTSTPVLPQDEVLSRVLFGVSAAQLSAAQGAELASALASLTGGGGFDVIGNLRQFAGLDRLALGGTQTTGTTISGGKYINKDLYLELTGGGRNGSAAQLEWRIRHNLSLVSRYGNALDPRYSNDTDASLSIRFRKDF